MLNTSESKLKNIGLQFFADPAPADFAPAPDPADPEPEKTPEEIAAEKDAELKRLQAEMAKQKNALDNATKEAAAYKKQLRAKQTTEEAEAEAAKEREEARDKELNELRKKFAVADISKRVLTFLGDEKTADTVANSLYGAEDVDAAIDAFNKAWAAKEKALRLEFSKIPAPAGGDGAPEVTKQDISKMSYLERMNFAQKFPDTYKKLTT